MSGFFERDGESLVPTSRAAATWQRDKVHGRLLAGLAARAADSVARDLGLRCARLTVDLLHAPPFAPIDVVVDVVHQTRRSATLTVELWSCGRASTRSSAALLAPSDAPPGEVWTAGDWDAPPPDQLRPISEDQRRLLPWDLHPVHGPDLVTADRKAVWIHDPIPLVTGETASPFVRLGMVADAVNPIANSGSRGLRYINTDLSLHVAREPDGKWFGFDVVDHQARDGLAVGVCRLHDIRGALGIVTTAGLAMRRPARHRRDG